MKPMFNKKRGKTNKKVEGTVPTQKIWVYCITSSKYRVLYHLTKAELQFTQQLSSSNFLWYTGYTSVLSAFFSDSLKTISDHLVFILQSVPSLLNNPQIKFTVYSIEGKTAIPLVEVQIRNNVTASLVKTYQSNLIHNWWELNN